MWCVTPLPWCSVSQGHFHLGPAQHKLQTGVISEAQTFPGTIRWGEFNFSSPKRHQHSLTGSARQVLLPSGPAVTSHQRASR